MEVGISGLPSCLGRSIRLVSPALFPLFSQPISFPPALLSCQLFARIEVLLTVQRLSGHCLFFCLVDSPLPCSCSLLINAPLQASPPLALLLAPHMTVCRLHRVSPEPTIQMHHHSPSEDIKISFRNHHSWFLCSDPLHRCSCSYTSYLFFGSLRLSHTHRKHTSTKGKTHVVRQVVEAFRPILTKCQRTEICGESFHRSHVTPEMMSIDVKSTHKLVPLLYT